MSPHETLFLENTNTLDIKYVTNNSFVQFQIWDFPGDFDFQDTVEYNGQTLTEMDIFKHCNVLVFVIDATDENNASAVDKLVKTVTIASKINPDIFFEQF